MYAIQKFVEAKMKENGITRIEMVKRLGYSNISKGCRRFDAFMKEAVLNPMILSNLSRGLEAPIKQIREKLDETRSEIERERAAAEAEREAAERKEFFHHLFCRTERNIPSPIFICAFMGAERMRYIRLPGDYNERSTEEQDAARKKLIADILERHDGEIPSFGRITHFVLRVDYDDREEDREVYDLHGNLITDPSEEYRKVYEGRAGIRMKGRDATNLFTLKIVL